MDSRLMAVVENTKSLMFKNKVMTYPRYKKK